MAQRDNATEAWEQFDAKARSQEGPYESAAVAQFQSEAVTVVRLIESNIPQFKRADDPSLTITLIWPYIEAALLKISAAYSTAGAVYRQWFNRFRPIIAKTMAEPAPRAPNVRVGILGTTPPQVISAINRRVTRLTGSVTETTAQQIRDVIAEARQEGVGVSELVTRIRRDVFADSITRARAGRIARTETVGALNEAAMLRARQNGVMRSKRWIDQRDGKVRPSHRAAAAQGWIPIDERYNNGLDHPHEAGAPAEEVIECRCSQGFTDLTPNEANDAAG